MPPKAKECSPLWLPVSERNGGVWVTLPEIEAVVCNAYQITHDQLCGRRREQCIVWPRQIVLYLMRELTGVPWREIGAYYGMHRTNPTHAYWLVRERISTYPKMKAAIEALKQQILSKPK